MTEEEWLASTNPREMLESVAEQARIRKLRLFACACCRQVQNPFVPQLMVRAVAAAEAAADDELGDAELASVADVVNAAVESARGSCPNGSGYLLHLCLAVAWAAVPRGRAGDAARHASEGAARAAADLPERMPRERPPEYVDELGAQADLCRDIFGNPFREVGFDPAWLTSDVLALAKGMYESRDFGAMPILADALQDAGCEDEEILAHCREPREHVRGCWVIDLLLGKQ
jgi:hypothetical protein